MKKRKLKGFVLPTLYVLIAISIFVGIIFLGRDIALTNKDYDYGVGALKEDIVPVVEEDTNINNVISSPVEEEKATLSVHFYSKDSDALRQQESLIFYENTYLPNTGVLYTSDDAFEVKSVFDGKVSEILDDEFFGKCIVIEHTGSIRTYYYGLENISVAVGDEVTSNEVLGVSKNNEIMSNKKSFMLEVYKNNELIDPENFIGSKITDYSEN